MKTQHFVEVAIGLAAVAAILLFGYSAARHTEAQVVHSVEIPASMAPTLTSAQNVWLDALEWQESQGNPAAINPKDSDGTPSYGCLQFKPGTFDEFSQLYGIATTSLMSCPQQRAIVTQMILHGVNLSRQFPHSIKLIGLPPVSTARS